MSKPKMYFIGGPTASGKTALALELAAKENGTIINADAMQVYAGLPVLTAQPSLDEKASCPHKLFEVLDADERSSAGHWLAMAKEAISQTTVNGRTPIIVGGTGLYFCALRGGLAEIPAIAPAERQTIIKLYDQLGHAAFRVELAKIDLSSAAKIKPNDKQRLIRAFEVARFTDRPLSQWQVQCSDNSDFVRNYEIEKIIVCPEREELYARIDARFLKMVKEGALEETSALMKRGLAPDLPAMKILGLRELAAYQAGEISLEDATAKAQQATRHYAKRQMTWFRNRWQADIKKGA